MTRVIGDEDRDKPTGTRHRMPSRLGSHDVYDRGDDLVVEWYDFGPNAPYESANLLIFGRRARAQMASLLGAAETAPPDVLNPLLAARFSSYFEVQDFARKHEIEFLQRVNFWP